MIIASIEDDPVQAQYIAHTLAEAGFKSKHFTTGMTLRIPFTLIDEVPDQATIIYLTGNVLVNNRLIGK